MSDDKNNQGSQDRLRISADEDYEVRHLAEKFGVPPAIVRKGISEVGNMRKDVEAFLTAYKKGEPI
jgi:hypothetical protein